MHLKDLMRDHIRPLLTAPAVALLLAGCAHGVVRGGFDACSAGATCTLGGKLQLFPGEPAGAAILTDNGQCTKLALPDAFYTDPLRQQWHDRIVEVQGRAFAQPNTETELGVLSWFSEKDRKLATGMCDQGLGIYVDTLRSASGQTWPGSP
ncbi:hypothetical protein [Pseudoxanthomonas sacheonensis]|uniref:hypothetical protein n=1 Tax=Pseudoxanthomonas sacheonensis TaxID=443615 RepID=UPI0013D1D217|nr:hypothetical protein [Pseudoxanthomonas sacheonensis]